MMWTLPLQFFKPLPGFIQRFTIKLNKLVISFLSLAVLPGGGKYLIRKACDKAFQVVKELGALEFNQALALSFRENGKSQSRIASSLTPFILIVSQISKKLARCACGSSAGPIPNCSCCTIWMRLGLISKLLALTVGLTMLG